MHRTRSTAPALALAVLAFGCTDSASDAARLAGPVELPVYAVQSAGEHFRANPLKGEHERPVPNDSKGNGVAQFQLSDDGMSLDYKLVVANTDNVTQAHIHIGPREGAGPVVVFLYGFNAAGTSENGVLAEGTITAANLIARPQIGFGATMAELVAAMSSGNAYVNVHTIQLPGGEIRNQIEQAGN
jgi:hypothetical protein